MPIWINDTKKEMRQIVSKVNDLAAYSRKLERENIIMKRALLQISRTEHVFVDTSALAWSMRQVARDTLNDLEERDEG